MAVTGTYTNRDVISAALRKIGVIASDAAATADDADNALMALNRMLKSWQNRGYLQFAVAEQTLTLTTAISYTLDPVRPLKIRSARLVRNGTELPMQPISRDEYDRLPVKTTTGTPTQFYYDRQREAALFYVWPGLLVANGETIKITYERELEDQTNLSDTCDVPAEWWDAVVYGLAARLSDDFMVEAPRVIQRAEAELAEALAFDNEGSVYFAGPYCD